MLVIPPHQSNGSFAILVVTVLLPTRNFQAEAEAQLEALASDVALTGTAGGCYETVTVGGLLPLPCQPHSESRWALAVLFAKGNVHTVARGLPVTRS